MSPIRFIALRADRLILSIALFILFLAFLGYIVLLRTAVFTSTPVPRTVLWHSLPVSTEPETNRTPFAVGAPAPDFTLADTQGENHRLSSYRGQPLLLYFWASWCTFCRDDLPQLEELYQTHSDDRLVILAVNLLEKPELVKIIAQQHGLSFPVLLDQNGAVSTAYLVKATPTYVFIDREGIVQAHVVGRPRSNVLQRNLKRITTTEESTSAPQR
ncbi:MAG: TlpA family protein disulfide reductase [Firmicutes bacterium]|nr:TlpA family protein disulfide reductase [Bacillota bacterium]